MVKLNSVITGCVLFLLHLPIQAVFGEENTSTDVWMMRCVHDERCPL